MACKMEFEQSALDVMRKRKSQHCVAPNCRMDYLMQGECHEYHSLPAQGSIRINAMIVAAPIDCARNISCSSPCIGSQDGDQSSNKRQRTQSIPFDDWLQESSPEIAGENLRLQENPPERPSEQQGQPLPTLEEVEEARSSESDESVIDVEPAVYDLPSDGIQEVPLHRHAEPIPDDDVPTSDQGNPVVQTVHDPSHAEYRRELSPNYFSLTVPFTITLNHRGSGAAKATERDINRALHYIGNSIPNDIEVIWLEYFNCESGQELRQAFIDALAGLGIICQIVSVEGGCIIFNLKLIGLNSYKRLLECHRNGSLQSTLEDFFRAPMAEERLPKGDVDIGIGLEQDEMDQMIQALERICREEPEKDDGPGISPIWIDYCGKKKQWYWTPYRHKQVWMTMEQELVLAGPLKWQMPSARNLELMAFLKNKKIAVDMDESDCKICHLSENGFEKRIPPAEYQNPEKLQGFVQELQSLYAKTAAQVNPLPFFPNFSVKLKHVYTELELFEENERTPLKSENIFKSMFHKKELAACMKGENIKTKLPRVILINGAACTGKTTFCQKVVCDWIDGSVSKPSYMKAFELVFLMKGKQLQCHLSDEMYSDIVSQLFPDLPHEDADWLKKYIEYNQDSVLFVFDGYDEMSQNQRDCLRTFLGNESFKRCKFAISSRTYATKDLIPLCDRQVRLCGFSTQSGIECVKRYLDLDKSKARGGSKQSFIDHIKQSPVLEDLVRKPLGPYILGVMHIYMGVDQPNPESWTDIFNDLLDELLKQPNIQHRVQKSVTEAPSKAVSTENLIEYLSKAAFETLLGSNHDFDDIVNGFTASEASPVSDSVNQDSVSKTLKKTENVERQNKNRILYFPHSSFQEYLSAKYIITKSSEHDDFKRFVKTDFTNRSPYVCLFVCGIASTNGHGKNTMYDLLEEIEGLQKQKLLTTPQSLEVASLQLACLSECKHDSKALDIVARSMPPCIELNWKAAKLVKKFDTFMKLLERACCSVEALDVKVDFLADVAKVHQLSVYLEKNKMMNSMTFELNSPKLNWIRIGRPKNELKSLVTPKLQKLVITASHKLSENVINDVKETLAKVKKLRNLRIHSVEDSCGLLGLLSPLENLSFLETVDLAANFDLPTLTRTIKDLNTLKELKEIHLRHDNVKGKSPTFLDLGGLGETQVERIHLTGFEAHLKHLPSLYKCLHQVSHFTLKNCAMTDEILINVVTHFEWQRLFYLDISDNKITDKGASVVLEKITQHAPKLASLFLEHNPIQHAVIKSLRLFTEEKSSLQSLGILDFRLRIDRNQNEPLDELIKHIKNVHSHLPCVSDIENTLAKFGTEFIWEKV